MFAGPGTVLFLAVVIVPFVYGLYLTFTSWDGVSLSNLHQLGRRQPFQALCGSAEFCGRL